MVFKLALWHNIYFFDSKEAIGGWMSQMVVILIRDACLVDYASTDTASEVKRMVGNKYWSEKLPDSIQEVFVAAAASPLDLVDRQDNSLIFVSSHKPAWTPLSIHSIYPLLSFAPLNWPSSITQFFHRHFLVSSSSAPLFLLCTRVMLNLPKTPVILVITSTWASNSRLTPIHDPRTVRHGAFTTPAPSNANPNQTQRDRYDKDCLDPQDGRWA